MIFLINGKHLKKKDCASGDVTFEKILVWDTLIFLPENDLCHWSERETLKIYQTVITRGFFQIWREE